MTLIQVKELKGQLAKYSGWRGVVINIHQVAGQNIRCEVTIYPPPNYDNNPETIWLDNSMLIKLR